MGKGRYDADNESNSVNYQVAERNPDIFRRVMSHVNNGTSISVPLIKVEKLFCYLTLERIILSLAIIVATIRLTVMGR